jgi:hypothetical protein
VQCDNAEESPVPGVTRAMRQRRRVQETKRPKNYGHIPAKRAPEVVPHDCGAARGETDKVAKLHAGLGVRVRIQLFNYSRTRVTRPRTKPTAILVNTQCACKRKLDPLIVHLLAKTRLHSSEWIYRWKSLYACFSCPAPACIK